MTRILILPGDGIGPEVTAQATRVLEAGAAKAGIDLTLEEGLIGGAAIDAAVREMGAVGAIAEPLYTTYVVPFEITGILLLVAIVGAIVLAKRHV